MEDDDDDDESKPATTTPQEKKAPNGLHWTFRNLTLVQNPNLGFGRAYSILHAQSIRHLQSKATPQATKSYHEMVAEWQVQQTPQQIPQLPDPPLFAQKAWHERDMSRPMLGPAGPIPIDKEYQAGFPWQKEFLANVPPSRDELLDEASTCSKNVLEVFHLLQ